MRIESLGPVVATRKYFRCDDNQQTTTIQVELGKPRPSPDAIDEYEFVCPFRISSSSGLLQQDSVVGVDELQSLLLALASISAKLHALSESLGLPLRWIGDEHGDLGIRIPDFVN